MAFRGGARPILPTPSLPPHAPSFSLTDHFFPFSFPSSPFSSHGSHAPNPLLEVTNPLGELAKWSEEDKRSTERCIFMVDLPFPLLSR